MGQFLRVNGDYNIKTADGAKIKFDTGPASAGGSVIVTGDLVVEGQTVSVAATNLDINDNIITLNAGETGSGVTLGYSGVKIDRGDLTPAMLLFEESSKTWLFAANDSPGPFNYSEVGIKVNTILTDTETENLNFSGQGRYGDLTLIGSGTGVISVFGTDTYEEHVVHDDDIPNKLYVDNAILNNPTFQIVAPQGQDTSVIISDKDITPNISTQAGSLEYFTNTTGYSTFGESAVSIVVDSYLVSQFFTNRVELGNLELGSGPSRTEITSKAGITNENIYVRTQGTGKLQTNYAVQLDKIAVTPAYVSDSNLIYASSLGVGSSGIWFVNDSTQTSKRNGELISKNKALVFSMLF